MRYRDIWLGIGIPLGLLFCLVSFAWRLFFLQTLFYLVTGWAYFLADVTPRITVEWNGIVTALLCLCAIAFGMHFFLLWLRNRVAGAAEDGTCLPWKARWTMSSLAVIAVMFVAGFATAGLTLQARLIVTTDRPLAGNGFRDAVNRMSSQNNLHQIALAAANYESAYGFFPPGESVDAHGKALHSWQTLLLPHVEQLPLYLQIRIGEPWDSPQNLPAFRNWLRVYRIPSVEDGCDSDGLALTHYASNVRVIGGTERRNYSNIPDGSSNTIMFGEVAERFQPWGRPGNWRDPVLGINKSPDGFGCKPSRGGASFSFCDGSVHYLSEKISPAVLKALSTPDGGEEVKVEDMEPY